VIKRKSKMKRPEKRSETITLRVTPTELAAITAVAKKNYRQAAGEAYKRIRESLIDEGILDDDSA
jgi:hypothetical protein